MTSNILIAVIHLICDVMIIYWCLSGRFIGEQGPKGDKGDVGAPCPKEYIEMLIDNKLHRSDNNDKQN